MMRGPLLDIYYVVLFLDFIFCLKESVTMKMESSFDHIWFVRDYADKIGSLTGAVIRCPDISKLNELPKKYTIWIRGSIDSVYLTSVMVNVSLAQKWFTGILN